MPELLLTLLRNREEFYSTLLPRIPNERFRGLLSEAVSPWTIPTLLAQEATMLTNFNNDVGSLPSTELEDWLKKPTFGADSAKTVISVESATARSLELERFRVMYLQDIVNTYDKDSDILQAELGLAKKSYSQLLQLYDGIRYHKVRLDP